MFWRFGGYASISTLDTILDKPDVTVDDLLDESDLIQELKQQNSKLIEFLREEPVLKKLLDYVVADKPSEDARDAAKEKDASSTKTEDSELRTPSAISFFGKGKGRSRSKSIPKDGDSQTEADKKEEQRKKYSYVACEVLSSDVWSITEALMEQREHLLHFWSYMRRPAPLDPLQAGYFAKVNEALLDKKTEEMLAFFKSLDGIIPAMLQHVDCPMVMDLLLKIISLERQEGGVGIIDWLQQQNLIPLLLGFLSPENNNAAQTSAGDFLKAIITISANATTQDQNVIGPNELTRQLVSDTCISQLISDMLAGGNPLTVGVGIIIEVIRKNNSDYDIDSQIGPEPKTSDPIYLGTLLRKFADRVPDFMTLIRSPSAKKADLKTAFGGRVEPLGFDRFKTCELMAELLHCSNMGLLNERGAEEDVRKRDAERERMKADGKLATPRAPASSTGAENSHEEFGSSVDSHGFHHAHAPSTDEEPEQIQRDEAQPEEDGFEKVDAAKIASDLSDEVSFDDFNEKVTEIPLSPLEKTSEKGSTMAESQAEVPQPLSPKKTSSAPNKPMLHFDPPPTAPAADSPTSAGVTDRLNTTSLDEDTVMTEFGEETSASPIDDDGPTELEKELARAERPAPLFSSRKAAEPQEEPTSDSSTLDQSVATIQPDGANPASTNGERSAFETEADGTPVVGDYLKMQFVEHQVVPTILDFFFRFPWNNFLHNVVYDVVQQVFNGTLDRGYNRTLAFDLYSPVPAKGEKATELMGFHSDRDITDRILEGQKASDDSQRNKGMRLGYMGHLTLIAEEVCKFGGRHGADSLDEHVLQRINRPEWSSYVEGTLTETREKDNAVLGGVRPENAMGVRQMGIGGLGGFSSNTTNTLANAGIGTGISAEDNLAMSEGTVGQSFEINSGSMLGGFGDGNDDDEMREGDDDKEGNRRGSTGSAFSEDEQASTSSSNTPAGIPPPLNIPPSRARKQLAARLAQRKKDAQAASSFDPDSADDAALQTAVHLPEDPGSIDLDAVADPTTDFEVDDPGLEVSGMGHIRAGASKFTSIMFEGSDSDSDGSSGFDEDEAGRDTTLDRTGGEYEDETTQSSASNFTAQRPRPVKRPSTREARQRVPLSDDEDDDVPTAAAATVKPNTELRSPFDDPADAEDIYEQDSSDDDAVEIKQTRRTRQA